MGRLIDADWFKSVMLDEPTEWMTEEQLVQFRAMVDLAPTVDAVPVRYSEWIPKEKADTPYGLEMECAKCGFSVIVNDALYFKFCPYCGAKMDERGNDSETD